MPRGFRDEDNHRRDKLDPVEIDGVECIRETQRAILCMIDGRERWIPQSCVHEDSEVYGLGHVGKLVVAGWFAAKELGRE